MRPLILCCAIAAQSVAFCHAQTAEQIIPNEKRMHDFGAVARAANTEHRFEINNPFKSDLEIYSVRASCGCTTPIVERKRIPPGQSGTILARYNTGSHTGQKGATLTVSIGGPIRTELQLNVKGYIRSDVVLTPGEANLGNLPEGETKKMEFTLNYAGRSDWSIEEIVSPLPFVKTQFEELSRAGGQVSYKVSVELEGSAPSGLIQNQLVIHTNDRRLTTFPVRLLATVEAPLEVSPRSIALGRVKPGEPIQQRMVLKGREEFRILDISSDDAEIRFENDEQSKKAHLINIIVAPQFKGRQGEIKGQMLLKTDMMDEPMKLDLNYTIETESAEPVPEVQAAIK